MKNIPTLMLVVGLLAGCVAQPQRPLSLTSDKIARPGKVGVAMSALPKQDTQVPGASCLLCLGFAMAANSSLTTHATTLSYEELPTLKQKIADILNKKGANAIVIAEDIDISKLPDAEGNKEGQDLARKNFSALKTKYGIDHLVMIDITAIGFVRQYSAYVPTTDPMSLLQGTGYIVDLKTNTYDWYKAVYISKGAGPKWDEPPKFPGLTNAYYQTLELAMDEFLQPFNSPAAPGANAVKAGPAAEPIVAGAGTK